MVARRIVHREHARHELRARSERAAALGTRERSGRTNLTLERDAAFQAISALEEPYRTVIRLRFFEEHTCEEIAEELGRSPATVRSQIHRGIELVRARMSPRQRSERSWSLLGWASGARAVERAPRLALSPALRGLAALAIVAGSLWLGSRLVEPDPAAEHVLAALPVERVLDPDERAQPATAANDVRAPSASRAALRPVPTSLSSGVAAVPEVAQHSLEILVVDPRGNPITGAQVGVVTLASFLPRGVSDAHGHCRVELSDEDAGAYGTAATLGRVTLQASSPAHVVSSLVHVPLDLCDGRPLEITLHGPPLVLAGRVVDEAGLPVEGAAVSTGDGSFVPPSGESVFESPWLPETRTDAEGSFVIAGLAREPLCVRVFASGFVEQRERLAPAECVDRLECTLVLRSGATLSGTVRGPDGRPAEQALVFAEPVDRPTVWAARLSGYDARLAGIAPRTSTDENGEFRLVGILPGTRRLWAMRSGDVASCVLELDPARPATWDVQLEASSGLVLRVIDERGAPRAGLPVRVRSDGLPDEWVVRIGATDVEGRLQIPDCLALVASVEVLDERMVAPLARATNLVPGPEEHVIVVPDRGASMGIVRGVLLGADGLPLFAAELKRYDTQTHSAVALHVDRASGRFEQALLPGRFLLACMVDRRGFSFGEHELEAGETLDVGFLRAPGTGMLMLVTGGVPSIATRPVSFRLSTRYETSGRSVFRELMRGSWPAPEKIELFPGHHWLEVFDESNGVVFRADAEITAGETVWMKLP